MPWGQIFKHAWEKGVLGFLESQENFPFTLHGIVQDIVINPHAFPSRQTPGQMLEAGIHKNMPPPFQLSPLMTLHPSFTGLASQDGEIRDFTMAEMVKWLRSGSRVRYGVIGEYGVYGLYPITYQILHPYIIYISSSKIITFYLLPLHLYPI